MVEQKSNYNKFGIKKGDRCPYCDEDNVEHWEIDHIIPKARGGLNVEENLIYCCRKCNATKKDKDLLEVFDIKVLDYNVLKKYYNSKYLCEILENKFKKVKIMNVLFTPTEKNRIKAVADASGETFSGYIRRQILMIVSEEESQS